VDRLPELVGRLALLHRGDVAADVCRDGVGAVPEVLLHHLRVRAAARTKLAAA
jgi:hypothetical protein